MRANPADRLPGRRIPDQTLEKSLELGVPPRSRDPVSDTVGMGSSVEIVAEILPAAPSRIERSPSLAALDELAREAWVLEPPLPHERKGIWRDEAALLVDGLLSRVARGRGALEIAIGQGLAALAVGDRVLRLGYSGLGDYARERLGVAGRTAQAMARLARELRERPILAEAVRRGEVSARKAQVVLAVARGEAEAVWVARARRMTVRALEAAVRARTLPAEGEGEEKWERVLVELSPEGRGTLDEAMALAGKILGPTAPSWQRLEALCDEFLGAFPVEEFPDRPNSSAVRWPVDDWLAQAKEGLEAEMRGWAFLDAVDPVAAPAPEDTDDPWRLDEELRRLAGMRDRWDEVLGHLALLIRMLGLWRDMGFASFGQYAAERLGMASRTVEQRVALERRLHALPGLREAMRAGRLSYEKARLVATCADDSDVDDWIRRAARTTCIALRHEVEARDGAQMRARPALDLRVPRRIAFLLDAALRAARQAAGRWITLGECLERLAQHFVDTWKPVLAERSTRRSRVVARDRGFCQVPGCSRAAAHVHHVEYRSHGGGDEPENLVSLCAPHHLHGIHRGYVRVRGRAPDHLEWQLGVRPD